MLPGDRKGTCFICGHWAQTELHHCLHGSRRQQADRYGLTVHLCHKCHMDLHDKGSFDLQLEQMAQKHFESKYGHEKFMAVFGKNYLEGKSD